MTSKWTADSIPDLTGRAAVVTGPNSGIGYEMTRALARKNAYVILACRNKDKGDAAARQICRDYPEARARFMQMDLSDLSSVRGFTRAFSDQHEGLHILTNNAGVMAPPLGRTADGFELQWGTNHLGHFALTGLLLGHMTPTPASRVVTVSSGGHRFGRIDFDNLNAEKAYDGQGAYAQSKLANLLFTYELERRLEAYGADAIAVAAHPGWTATNLQVHWPVVRVLNPIHAQKPEMGALPTLYAATASDVRGGRLLRSRRPAGDEGVSRQGAVQRSFSRRDGRRQAVGGIGRADRGPLPPIRRWRRPPCGSRQVASEVAVVCIS